MVDLNNLQVFADLVMGMDEELYRIKSLVLKARQLDGKLATITKEKGLSDGAVWENRRQQAGALSRCCFKDFSP